MADDYGKIISQVELIWERKGKSKQQKLGFQAF